MIPPALRSAVFLDRDGVINRTHVVQGVPHPPASAETCEILPGVPAAMAMLMAEGFPLIVVTNQPDVARRSQTKQEVERIHAFLMTQLPIDAFYVCYHDNSDACECRKPKAGMLLQAAREHGIELSTSFMVGDRSGDILAGSAAGCKTILIDLPYSQGDRCCPDARVADLTEAAQLIVKQVHARAGGSARVKPPGGQE